MLSPSRRLIELLPSSLQLLCRSLILTTNVDLGADKGEILKALSALVAKSTGKPESYVGEFPRV